LRHTPRGGAITLSATPADGNRTEISVNDTGCGIDPEHLPKLCDRFYRVDRARFHDDDGAGLGLALVKSIMELHQGTLAIRSQLGHGTTVTLRFPVAPPASSAEARIDRNSSV
jgi:signal transduction histidine kinase